MKEKTKTLGAKGFSDLLNGCHEDYLLKLWYPTQENLGVGRSVTQYILFDKGTNAVVKEGRLCGRGAKSYQKLASDIELIFIHERNMAKAADLKKKRLTIHNYKRRIK